MCPTIYGYVSPLTYRTLGSETPRIDRRPIALWHGIYLARCRKNCRDIHAEYTDADLGMLPLNEIWFVDKGKSPGVVSLH